MSVSVALALGFALLGSLCLLAHTIYRRPTTTAAAPTPSHNRFPVVGSEPGDARDNLAREVLTRDVLTPDGLSEVDDAYQTWLQSLNDLDTYVEPASASSSAR